MNRLLIAGLLVALAGMCLLAIGSVSQGSVSAGGFILIGPIPIVFGSGPNGGLLAALALVVGILMLALFALIAWRLVSRSRGSMPGNL